MIGEDGDDFRCGEGHMQEKADAVSVPALPQLLSDRDQVIVVNPDRSSGWRIFDSSVAKCWFTRK